MRHKIQHQILGAWWSQYSNQEFLESPWTSIGFGSSGPRRAGKKGGTIKSISKFLLVGQLTGRNKWVLLNIWAVSFLGHGPEIGKHWLWEQNFKLFLQSKTDSCPTPFLEDAKGSLPSLGVVENVAYAYTIFPWFWALVTLRLILDWMQLAASKTSAQEECPLPTQPVQGSKPNVSSKTQGK